MSVTYITTSINEPKAKESNKKKADKCYLPAVDGLRALAVLAVLAYHLNLPFAQGGLVGVTVFFVISGFLITSILYTELVKTNKIDLKRFWLRRIRRLFPAIALVIIVTAIASWFLNPTLLYKLKCDLFPALFWFTNWFYIFHQQSYFDAIASPSPVLHFWSLSIEEQFYLVWPLILFGLYKLEIGQKGIRRVCLGLTGISALLMLLLFDPAGDPSRVYYGTDTRAFSLLIGAYLALKWPAFSPNFKNEISVMPDAQQKLLNALGAIGLAVVLILACFVQGTSPFWYRGGLLLASICTALLIVSLTLPASPLKRFFAQKPIVWVGLRSYGIYLWHYPILLLMNPANQGTPSVLKMILEIAIILLISELSYKFVENPIRNGIIGKTLKQYRNRQINKANFNNAKVACLTTLVLVLFSGTALATAQNTNQGQGLLSSADIEAGTGEGTLQEQSKEDSEASGDIEVTGYEPLLIGDSVTVSLIDDFHQAFTGGLLDSCGNRNIDMGKQVYNYYKDRGEVGKNVIIALGTNGAFTTDELEAFINEIGSDHTIWLITNRTTANISQATNQSIVAVAPKHSNVSVIDWNAYSADHDDWVGSDGIHLTIDGRKAYTQMIVEAIGDNATIEAARKKADEEAGGAWMAPADGSMTSEMYDSLLQGLTPAAQVSRLTTGEAMPS